MMAIKKAGGFTLIEVMVALTTLAIALLAVTGLYFSSIRADTRNRDESRALFLANQKIEELRSQDYASIVNGYDYAAHPFDLDWTVTTPQAWRKDIVVTVTLPKTHNKQRSVRVTTVRVQLD
jgi:prepilin-type N-terminal cleavage/methylation domain-containing protein